MSNREISTRQIIIFYCIYSFSIKFLTLPSLLAKNVGHDAWIAALVGVVLELCFLYLVLLLIKKNLSNVFMKIFGLVIIAPILLYEIVIISKQTYGILNNNLFEYVPYFLFVTSLVLLAVYFCLSHPRGIFRCAEIFFVFLILGVVLSVAPAIPNINVREILPIFDTSVGAIIKTVFINAIFFEPFLFIFVFRKNIEKTKLFKTKFMVSALIAGAVFVFFVFMFCALFGSLAPYKEIAVTNLTVYSAYITSGGHLDWVILTAWLLLVLLRFGVTCAAAFKCVRDVLPKKFMRPTIPVAGHRPRLLDTIARKKAIIVFIAVLVALLPQSIARPAQMTSKVILTEIAIDRATDYTVSATAQNGKSPENLTATAPTLFGAINQIALDQQKQVSFAHCNQIVLGEGLADENIAELLHYFMFNTEIRNTAKMAWVEKGRKTTMEQFYRDYYDVRPSVLANGTTKSAVFRGGLYNATLTETQTDGHMFYMGDKIDKRFVFDNEVVKVTKNNSAVIGTRVKITVKAEIISRPNPPREMRTQIRKQLQETVFADVNECLAILYPDKKFNVTVDVKL